MIVICVVTSRLSGPHPRLGGRCREAFRIQVTSLHGERTPRCSWLSPLSPRGLDGRDRLPGTPLAMMTVSAAAASGGMIVIVIVGFIQLGDLRVRGLRLFWCREDRSKIIAPDMVYQARAGGFDGPPKTAPWWRGRDRPEYHAGCASPRRGTVARPIPARRAGAAREDPSTLVCTR